MDERVNHLPKQACLQQHLAKLRNFNNALKDQRTLTGTGSDSVYMRKQRSPVPETRNRYATDGDARCAESHWD